MKLGTKRRLWTWVPIFSVFFVVWLVLSLQSVQEYLILRGAPPLDRATSFDVVRLPDTVVFTCLDGSELTVDTLQGKPAVISVFATWCPPCMAEVPGLERLRTTMADDATVLMVALDDHAALAAWNIERKGDPAAFATASSWPAPLETKAIPLTLVLDSDGMVVSRLTGAFQWDDPSVVQHLHALGQ